MPDAVLEYYRLRFHHPDDAAQLLTVAARSRSKALSTGEDRPVLFVPSDRSGIVEVAYPSKGMVRIAKAQQIPMVTDHRGPLDIAELPNELSLLLGDESDRETYNISRTGPKRADCLPPPIEIRGDS